MRLFSEAANKKQDVDSRVYEIFQSRVVGVTSGGATTSTTETQRLQDSTQPSKQPVKKILFCQSIPRRQLLLYHHAG
jgi:hypothetical protein